VCDRARAHVVFLKHAVKLSERRMP
jgi:hypothetical protein